VISGTFVNPRSQTRTIASYLAARVCRAVLFFAVPLAAQQYAFQYFGVEQGLTNLAVKTLFQDRTGFIWLGTEHGVFRYEGIRFREFTNNDGLKPGVTGSIGEAPDGSVLVGNYLGLSRLRGERFESVPLPGDAHIIGYDNIVASGNRTWIATDAGLLSAMIGADGNLVLRPGPAPPDPSLKEAQSIFVRDATLWWGCGKALCRAEGVAVSGKAGKVTVMDQTSGLMPDVITAIVQDPAGNLWVEQNRRLLVLRPGTTRFSPPDTPLPLAGFGSLQVDSDGHVLVPTTEGLAIGQGGTTFRMAKRDAGLLPPVYSVLQDREGSVWLGLAGRGLAKWLGYGEWESFSAQSGLAGETVYEILPQPDGQVWAGTEAGLFRGDRKDGRYTWTLVRSVGAVPVHTVEDAGDGHFWIGTDYGGVARFDPPTEKTEWFGAKDGLTGNLPWALLIDRSHAVWVGNVSGVFRKPAGSSKFEHIPDVTARCFALEQAPDGDIWAGTMNGLWRLDADGHGKVFTRSDGLIDNAVVAIAPDPSGDIWAGYRLNGVVSRLHLDGDKTTLTHFRPPAGSAMNITYFLAFDAHGKLWAGTNLGVRVFDGKDHWDPFDHRDGLIWDDCDLHGFAAEPDGHVWIGTSGGLSRFMPKQKTAALTPPRTVFTSLTNGKIQLDPSHSYSVEYSSDPLIARFTALRFGHDRDLTFRYKLDPLYKTWRETSDRELQFPALPPGNYRLDVEARDALSGWSNQPASFVFKINAPWWRQWWFLGGCALSGSLLAGLLLRQKNAREESIRRALENAVAERTQELSHQYRHDVLTGLPNRLLFGERLHRELLSARRDEARVAVLFIDLDRFKRINDTWGHQTGDLFLRQISERLRAGLRSGETIARIGGDEFTVLIPGLRDKEEAERRGWDLLRTLEAPIRIEGKNVFATMSVGISTFPDDALEPGALMAAADAAMYAAKGSGKNQVQLFEAGMTEAASRPQNIEDRLREALKNGGFRLRYQAQYTIDGRLSGFEALLRIHGQERDLGPGEFIPIAEESGLIVEMGAWVLQEACWQMRRWNDAGFRDIRIAVNVSVMQLAHPGFEGTLMHVIEETGIDPRNLELELTETALVKDTGDSAGLLNRIRKRGIQVALDDFGTGFSPMQYLHQLPVDVVKIDQVFVKDLDGKPSSIPLVEGMVKLAKTLSLKVVAEGVETPGQFEILRDIGFDVAQGNLLSFPLVAEEAEVLLRSGVLASAPALSPIH
jgi:diguanylate cyclase (GGDEF)-like protein